MIAHVVLFRPKESLGESERQSLVRALETALTTIPSIARARIGRRRVMDRPYDRMNSVDFPYIALLEFVDEPALRAYLDHPAHDVLGAQFYVTSASALAYDFDLIEDLPGGMLNI